MKNVTSAATCFASISTRFMVAEIRGQPDSLNPAPAAGRCIENVATYQYYPSHNSRGSATLTRVIMKHAPGAVVSVSLPATGLNDTERSVLVRMARLLYPHDALKDTTYAHALQSLLDRAETEPMIAADLQTGVAMLTHLANGDWLAGSHDDQVDVLERIEEEAFFRFIQAEVKWQLYEKDPEVWELIGYEGPSVGFGGYLNRGFDDIDWLPLD